MNQKENAPPNIGYRHLLDNTIGYQPRYTSPDSDSSSSISSIFSNDDGKSSQSSPLSSPVKSERSWNGERCQTIELDTALTAKTNGIVKSLTHAILPPPARTSIQIQQLVNEEPSNLSLQQQSHTNPRRTQSFTIQSSVVCQTSSRYPPQLTRQCDRTQNFVENLVGKLTHIPSHDPQAYIYPQDTSTQMIEVIWPMSISHCDKDYLGGKNLIGLRTFIQEVLKRSKTSYYTLQVALYYLVLIKPCITAVDCSQPHTELTHAQRAMQCGRRMFLAALILASKYLQDRNYSARAWSKISGLKISEINSNEMAFVIAVNWKLHIPEPQFQKWANIVFKYSTSQSASSPTSYPGEPKRMTWRQIIPRLTSELNEIDIEQFSRLSLKNDILLQPQYIPEFSGSCSMDGDKTPTPATVNFSGTNQAPPFSPRITALPTPAMTPHMNGYCTPAARSWCQGQAMKETMQQIQQDSFKTCSYESWPKKEFLAPTKPLTRVMSSGSIISSPESMISDISGNSFSSRTSRSSSICSSASYGALGNGCSRKNPAASHRSALASLNGSSYVPACVGRSELYNTSTDRYPDNAEMDATLALLNLARTDEWSNSNKKENGQKRARPSSMSEEMRTLLSQSFEIGSNTAVDLVADVQAKTCAFPKPQCARKPLDQRTAVGSQIGARKKQRNCSRGTSWVSSSPLVVCYR